MSLQLYCRHLLFDVCGAAVKDPEKCLLIEALNFCFNRLNIGHVVAVR